VRASRTFPILAAAALLCSCSKKKEEAGMGFSAYKAPDNGYTCQVPDGWEAQRFSTDASALLLVKGAAGDPVTGLRPEPAVTISVRRYPAGNPYFKSSAEFIKAQGGAARKIRDGARPGGWAFEEFEGSGKTFFPPNDYNAKEISLRRRFLVLEKGAEFYVLEYAAPADKFMAELPAFMTLSDTFRPSQP
jgi:hypothetical protein